MNTSMSLASEADYDGIMEISKDIYAGFDYLPNVLRRWLTEGVNEPWNRHNLVLKDEATNKVIGYQSYSIQDGGKYAVQQALRVDENVRGLNIGKKFMTMGEEHLHNNKIKLQIKGSYQGTTPAAAFCSPSMGTLINERAAFLTELPWSSFHRIVASKINPEGHSFKTLKLAELARVLGEKSDFSEEFIIKDFLVLDWVPYHVNHLLNIPTTHFNDIFSLVDDKNHPRSLSVMTRPYSLPVGARFALDIYTKDIDVAKKHVNEQLRHLLIAMPEKERDDTKLVVQLFVDCEVAEGVEEYVLDELKLGQLWEYSKNVDGKVTTFRMFEKEVKTQKDSH